MRLHVDSIVSPGEGFRKGDERKRFQIMLKRVMGAWCTISRSYPRALL